MMEHNSIPFDFHTFSQKLEQIQEVACDFQEEFVCCEHYEQKYRLIPNEGLISKWEEWQETTITKTLTNLSSFLTSDQIINLLYSFEKTVLETFGSSSTWLNGNFQQFFHSSKLQHIFQLRHAPEKLISLEVLENDIFTSIPPSSEFFFYLKKAQVPVGTNLILWGDIHGSVHSLCRSLENLIDPDWKIKSPQSVFVFLGDFIDRGVFGLETLFVLFSLKIRNPDQVYLLRGDHELPSSCLSAEGFILELRNKIGTDWAIFYKAFAYVFNSLPIAVYLQVEDGNQKGSFIQLNHGGVELGFLPTPLLSSPEPICHCRLEKVIPEANLHLLNSPQQCRFQFLLNKIRSKNLCYLISPMMNGFLWGDFLAEDLEGELFKFTYGRGFAFGKEITKTIIKASSPSEKDIRVIFRGHQHSDSFLWELIFRKGLFPLWNEKLQSWALKNDLNGEIDVPLDLTVFTLISCPASGLLFSLDSFIQVNIHSISDWKIKHHYSKKNGNGNGNGNGNVQSL